MDAPWRQACAIIEIDSLGVFLQSEGPRTLVAMCPQRESSGRVRRMQSYPVDIEPNQVVQWIMAERRAAPSKFRIIARRALETRELPERKELRLGDEERENLSETATVATLQIAPAHPSDGWLLTDVVEDEIGPSASEEAEMTEEEQEIDVDVFYNEFIHPGRGNVSVFAEVAEPAGKARLARLINSIEKDRHASDRRGGSPRSMSASETTSDGCPR